MPVHTDVLKFSFQMYFMCCLFLRPAARSTEKHNKRVSGLSECY